ncbi:MAG: METTL5 family protein [Methanomassiliicoccales archaeon]
MKKKELEILLEAVQPFQAPNPTSEQYHTPAIIAADMLFTAYSLGDIYDKNVIDLGCGTGMLAIAAALLGARSVKGVERDPSALELAKLNVQKMGVNVELILSDIQNFQGNTDTVVMNPPFGAQNRHADRPFLDKAMEVAQVAYSLHNAITQEFLLRMIQSAGAEVRILKRYKLGIPHTFAFHKRERKDVSVLLLRIQTR